ncbi:MAG: glycosyl transferase, group 1 [uncultured bacterium]|uniref:Glycosyl transferase, group 1 family n=1 Tax=Candidatus Daviesbacteria bacterium GW2011_GWC2_40_12 TaxID=1618431 RepID=A0A0G0QPQ4_9BACT|nr:MAG: glycosyl transferase, group 1 [uncultured bacterium]KKQ82961.1 MAG: Glycosyl transferase, group 1 family [Candidatus Daviesbacteria bacterium GW2011_GWF2_38_7]KKR16794.1 MAG: Glycosyl transferase, group 1 family [Candidatus Daviesbacteria bacterium GW2011_GWA2_39_33]KKR24642.1 MAG: Glycosyl transferase, group 1 family [Candidatus Daviesbacteria bacterium GW2011_GWB1_39_5]KKR42424.1 MAG: Glycosyl transferase, group 1 family [Candidatus Daviesbacteria bacterium GW2011_GWC2_40_12]OGE22337
MKVLFISPNSPFESIGGVERYVINLINYFKARGDIKTFLILPTTQKSHTVKDGNMTIYYDSNLCIPRKKRSASDIASKAEGFSDLLEDIIKKQDIDVICAENILFGPPASYSLRLNMIAALYKIPLMLRLHMYPETPLQIALTNELMWDHVSCVSKSVAGDCFQKGTDINKLSTDYLGVNTFDFKPISDSKFNLKKELGLESDVKIVLTAGRIITGTKNMLREKGMINLIEAFSRISPRFPKIRLLIGVAKASANLKDEFDNVYEMLLGYIKINNIEDKTIVKMFELDQMPNIYRGSDVLVLPAEKNETLGQIFIEAMACGTPVIGAKTGGMPEIISDGNSGYLVQPNDPIILAQKIEKILNDKKERNMFIKNGHKTVEEKFTAEKQFSDFHKLLKSIMADND